MQAIMPTLGWRWLLALSSVPCFILLIFSNVIPESPRYLCSRGKISEAMLVLERIARMNNKALPPGTVSSEPTRGVDNNNDSSVTRLLPMPEDSLITDEDTNSKSNVLGVFRSLWSGDLIRSTLLLWLVQFTNHFVYYGLLYLISELSSHRSQQKDSDVYINVLATSFAEIPGLLSVALLIDCIGRRMTLGGMSLLCCAFIAPIATRLGEGLAITLLFCARACVMGTFAVVHVFSTEIYPTSCRNTGVGFSYFFGRIGSIVGPVMITALLENHLHKEAVLLMDLLLFLAGLACTLFPHETKGREIH